MSTPQQPPPGGLRDTECRSPLECASAYLSSIVNRSSRPVSLKGILSAQASTTGVPVSLPTSRVSSKEKRPPIMLSTRPWAAWLSSTNKVPVPPSPLPPPSYLKSKRIRCLPGASGWLEETRYLCWASVRALLPSPCSQVDRCGRHCEMGLEPSAGRTIVESPSGEVIVLESLRGGGAPSGTTTVARPPGDVVSMSGAGASPRA